MKSFFKWVKRMLIVIGVIIVLVVAGIAIFLQQPQFGKSPEGNHLEVIKHSPNHTGEKFSNPGGITTTMGFLKALTILPEWLNGKNLEPARPMPFVKRKKEEFAAINDTIVRATWFGHSAFLLEMEGQRILLDPMLGNSSAPVSFMTKRFNDTLPLAIEDLPAIDAVLYSHDHYDHLDYSTVLALKDKVAHFYVPLGLGSHLRKWGVDRDKITELDWWGEINHNGLVFAAAPAQHFSGRGIGDRDATLWCSWVIRGKKHRIFFNGDSGYSSENFKAIGEKYGPFDLCMVECGQYNELWQEIHMMPEETAQAHLDLKGEILMPIHWGAFNLALHEWRDPIRRVTKAAEANGSIVATPRVGESITLGEPVPSSNWWEEVN